MYILVSKYTFLLKCRALPFLILLGWLLTLWCFSTLMMSNFQMLVNCFPFHSWRKVWFGNVLLTGNIIQSCQWCWWNPFCRMPGRILWLIEPQVLNKNSSMHPYFNKEKSRFIILLLLRMSNSKYQLYHENIAFFLFFYLFYAVVLSVWHSVFSLVAGFTFNFSAGP